MESSHHIHGTSCLCGFQSLIARERTEHITRRALNAFAHDPKSADDLRDTPAGRALMAEALEEEAYRMDVVISNGDAAEQAAPAPGETGRGGAVTARDALYENPAQYLRERADAYRTETPDE